MAIPGFNDNEPILISEWEKLPALQRIYWSKRALAAMVRCKLVIGEFTPDRQCLITPANMRKALQVRQRNIGSDEPFDFD